MMRMKSGAGKHTNMREVYFYDMVQYDPKTGSQREIRRARRHCRGEYPREMWSSVESVDVREAEKRGFWRVGRDRTCA